MPKTKSDKRDEAETRQEEYDKLTIQQKIDKLDKKLGKGIGAKRQRTKLEKKLGGK